MRPLVPLLACLLLLPLATGAATAPGTVEGAGTPLASSALCGSPPPMPAPTHVTLVRVQTPFYEWEVVVEAAGALCPVVAAARCWAGGSLTEGLVLYNCSDGGEGVVGPVLACAQPGQEAAVASGWFRYENALGHLDGALTYALAGDAVDEANVCR